MCFDSVPWSGLRRQRDCESDASDGGWKCKDPPDIEKKGYKIQSGNYGLLCYLPISIAKKFTMSFLPKEFYGIRKNNTYSYRKTLTDSFFSNIYNKGTI